MTFFRFVLSAAFCVGCAGWSSAALAFALDPVLLAQTSSQESEEAAQSERPTLSLGSNGPLVIELQLRLQDIGLYDGEITGEFGESTRLALEAFQREYGLEASGSATAETWQALENPATAKLEAALEAKESDATTSEEPGEDSAASSDSSDRSTSDDSGLIQLPQSPLGLALAAAACGGLGIGGFGFWKALSPRLSRDKKKKSTRQTRSLPATASLALPSSTAPNSNRLPADGRDPERQLSAPQVSNPRDRQSKNRKNGKPSSHTGSNLPLVPPSSSLTPPPPPSAIEQTDAPAGASALNLTTRLTRVDPIETLMGQLQSTDPTLRRKAVWELGQRGDSRAIQPLVNLMGVSDSKQRSLILAALSEIGTQTLKPMKRALAMSLQDSNAEVRKNAIRDLTRIYDLVAQISSLLAIATEDEDPEVRDTARWALGQLNRIRNNAGLNPPENQQLLKQSVSPPETFSDEFQSEELQLDTASRDNLN